MEAITIKTIGLKIKEKRGDRGLRETAKEVEISPSTLSRIENGHIPDLETFGKLCKWLQIDASTVLGLQINPELSNPQIGVHFRKENTLKPETASALANMIMAAQRAMLAKKKSN